MTLERAIVLIILVALAIFLLKFLFGLGDGDAAAMFALSPVVSVRRIGARSGT